MHGSRLVTVNRPSSTFRSTATIGALTLALGACVAVSWLAFGGTASFRGPIRALEDGWPLIYGSQALFAAMVGFVAGPFLVNAFGFRGAVIAILTAWIGEFVALTLGGTILANELVPEVGWFYWLMGTGGPLQPLAALVGLWLGSRRGQTPQAPMAEATSNRPS